MDTNDIAMLTTDMDVLDMEAASIRRAIRCIRDARECHGGRTYRIHLNRAEAALMSTLTAVTAQRRTIRDALECG